MNLLLGRVLAEKVFAKINKDKEMSNNNPLHKHTHDGISRLFKFRCTTKGSEILGIMQQARREGEWTLEYGLSLSYTAV